jgi:uncharacterized protein
MTSNKKGRESSTTRLGRAACLPRAALPLLLSVLVSANSSALARSSHPQFDIIIVGAGIAGICAALEAASEGARILLLDVNSMPGGHAIQSSGGIFIAGSDLQLRLGVDDSPDLAFEDWVRYGEDPDKEWVRLYVDSSVKDVYQWLQSYGVRFTSLMHVAADGNRRPRHHVAEGSGRGLMVPLMRAMLTNKKIEFLRSVYVEKLVMREGAAVGVRGREVRSGREVEYAGKTVVIATGGFASNLKMVEENWPQSQPRAQRMLGGSGVHSQGSGHRMVAEAGGELKDMDRLWIYPTGTINPLNPGSGRGIEVLSYNLWINSKGETIKSTGSGTLDHITSILKLGDEYFWSLLDASSKEMLHVTGSDWQVNREEKYRTLFANPDIVKTADSLDQLAALMGVNPTALGASIAAYNLKALVKIERPPFYAIKHYPLVRKTMGGIRTNLRSQVLRADSGVIEGLYAAGEAAGFGGGNINGKRALEGTFLGPCVLTGRVAGRYAAQEALGSRSSESR